MMGILGPEVRVQVQVRPVEIYHVLLNFALHYFQEVDGTGSLEVSALSSGVVGDENAGKVT